ncbi:response regulator [Paracoccus liaowanqingii]|uniref:Response regulator n=1 Tax=Paracoccus liaowanqingii TaxID=2560053 RepID=A0A4P7HKS1_9RHOB|nr:response regulator [Paracoccus liaowanqingii]QBX34788.1 response regulator [Paracoccus liaowanqingii]TGN36897.1 response regulator [Paracoccus liaowanqingii]
MQMDILMIEDEPNIAEAVRFLLTREGWRVGLHADGAGAIEAIRAAAPRLVILDLMLPNRSGAQILDDLRAEDHAALATTPVLMLTARGQSPDAGARADAVLAKPFDNDELRRTVRRMLP